MYSFDDSLEGVLWTTKAELNARWTALRESWETLVRPYAVPTFQRVEEPETDLYSWNLGPNKEGKQPPPFLLNSYIRWRNSHKAYHLIAQRAFPSLLGIWEERFEREQLRYNTTYNRLYPGTPTRKKPPTQDQLNTDTPAEVEAQVNNPDPTTPPEPDDGKSFLQMLKDDIGTYALVIGGGFLAYNIFFRLAEGGFFRSRSKRSPDRGGNI